MFGKDGFQLGHDGAIVRVGDEYVFRVRDAPSALAYSHGRDPDLAEVLERLQLLRRPLGFARHQAAD